MAESGPLGVLLKASVGDAARFCASRDRQSTGNSRSKPHGPKTRASCVVVQNVPLGALISKRAEAPQVAESAIHASRSHPHRKHQTGEEGARGASEARGRGRRGGGVKALALAAAAWESTCGTQGEIHS